MGASAERPAWGVKEEMQMFHRIVVPLDGSRFAEAALAPARELARAFGARLLLVRAVGPSRLPYVVGQSAPSIDWEQTSDANAYLDGIVERLRAAGYAAGFVLNVAEPGAGIAHAAELGQADLIVMAAHRRWSLDVSGEDSVTLRALAHSRVPILAWRGGASPEADGGPDVDARGPLLARVESPIVVPLDGSRFAEGALPVAEALVRAFGSYLVLVRAVEGTDATPPASAAQSSGGRLEEAQAYLDQMRDALARRRTPAIALAREGSPLGVIDLTWRQEDATLVVMASHGRTGAMRSFVGSVAAQVIEESEAPVLVVRPPDESYQRHEGQGR